MKRSALVLLLAATGLFGQPSQPRSEEERTAELKKRVVAALQVQPGATVADVGCGDGFYTIALARFIGPSGKVFAVDVDDTALSKLSQHVIEQGLKNVDLIKSAADDPKLADDSLDAALIVNAYHEMPAHKAMLRHILAALKAGGNFVLMEGMWGSRETQSREEQVKHHMLAPKLAKHEVESAGFEIVPRRGNLWVPDSVIEPIG